MGEPASGRGHRLRDKNPQFMWPEEKTGRPYIGIPTQECGPLKSHSQSKHLLGMLWGCFFRIYGPEIRGGQRRATAIFFQESLKDETRNSGKFWKDVLSLPGKCGGSE